jgi:hypothetical protein
MDRALFAVAAATVVALLAAVGCTQPRRAALQLDGNRLTVYNDTAEEWRDVEIRLNHHFRVQPDDMPPGAIFQAPLDSFVAGYGQRFNFQTMQITDLRLTAKRASGEPLELQYQFQKGGLEGALEGFKGKS